MNKNREFSYDRTIVWTSKPTPDASVIPHANEAKAGSSETRITPSGDARRESNAQGQLSMKQCRNLQVPVSIDVVTRMVLKNEESSHHASS